MFAKEMDFADSLVIFTKEITNNGLKKISKIIWNN